MRKFLVAVMLMMPIAATVQASEAIVPAWACHLSFKGHAKGIQIILGKAHVNALGTLTCVSPFSEVKEIPVEINFGTHILLPRVTIGSFAFAGESLQISLFNYDPIDLLGTYAIAQAQATVGIGAGAWTAIHTSIPSLTLKVSVQLTHGLGLNVGLTDMTIKAIENN